MPHHTTKAIERRRVHMWLPVKLLERARQSIAPTGLSLSAHVSSLLAEDLRRRQMQGKTQVEGEAR